MYEMNGQTTFKINEDSSNTHSYNKFTCKGLRFNKLSTMLQNKEDSDGQIPHVRGAI